jgi:hypothetical protein
MSEDSWAEEVILGHACGGVRSDVQYLSAEADDCIPIEATHDLLLIANQPINGTGMQASGDGDIGRGRVN